MKIGELDSKLLLPNLNTAPTPDVKSDKSASFMDYLTGALGQVDALQKDAASSAEKLALGDESYLHNTMIAYEKANLALQLTVEVRNKMVEAYQEIMRIQM